jgi:hypothetical protein
MGGGKEQQRGCDHMAASPGKYRVTQRAGSGMRPPSQSDNPVASLQVLLARAVGGRTEGPDAVAHVETNVGVEEVVIENVVAAQQG